MKKQLEVTVEQRSEIIALRDDAIDGYTRHKSDFEALERGYVNVLSDKQRLSLKRREKSALTPNLIKPKVDMVVRDVMKSFFNNDELASLTAEDGVSEEDEIVTEVLVKEIKEFSREQNLYTTVKPIIRNKLIYGTAITKVYFSPAENTIKIQECGLDTVFIDPRAATPNDIKYLVHRIDTMTLEDVERQYGTNVDWGVYVDDSLIGNRYTSQSREIGKYQRIELFEVYHKKGTKWFVTTILNDDTIVRYAKPLKDGLPFIVSQVEPQLVLTSETVTPVRAYGGSFISPLLPLQTEYTIKRNQQIDATDVQLNQRFIVTKTSGLREDDLISNRKKIVVDEINSIKELPIPRLNDSIFDVQQLIHEAEEMSGVTKFSQGMDGGGQNKTATETMALQQQASGVIDDVNRAVNESFFRPLVNMIVRLTYKYKQSYRFVGIDRTRPLRQKVTINVGVGSTNKMLAMQNNDNTIAAVTQAIQTFLSVGDNMNAQKYIEALDKAMMEKFKLLGQDTIVDAMKKREEELEAQQMQEQMMMQEQQMMQQPQQGMM